MTLVSQQIAARDFSAKTLRALSNRGIVILGPVAIPGAGDLPWANAERGYSVDDNGTGRILTFREVLDLA